MKRHQIKAFGWGMAAGAIAMLIVVFSTGWVVTRNTARAEAEAMASKALMNRLALMDLAPLMQEPKKEQRLKELKNREVWGTNNRNDYVEEQSGTTIPGETKTDRQVAGEVARRLMIQM